MQTPFEDPPFRPSETLTDDFNSNTPEPSSISTSFPDDMSITNGDEIPGSGSCSNFSSTSSDESTSLALMAFIIILAAKTEHDRKTSRKPRRKSYAQRIFRFKYLLTFADVSEAYGDEMFRKAFRMSYSCFETLLNNVRDLLEKNFKAPTEYRRGTIPPDIRLAITLRILAGASYCDFYLAYQVAESTIREIFTTTCDALMSRLYLKGFPSTEAALRKIARGFQTSRKSLSPLSGCVGAVDGICVKIRKPTPEENPAHFYSRKGYYAIPVQALCDSNYVFRFCSAKCTGGTHDSLAYSVSGLRREIDSGVLGDSFYIVGDEAYTCTETLITPFPKTNADIDQDNFNFFLSSLRIHIEQAFGMLVARWRILRGGLEFTVDRCTDIICLLMKLHNFCIEHDGERFVQEYELTQADKEQLEVDMRQWYQESREVAREFQQMERQNRPTHEGLLSQETTSVISKKRERLVQAVKDRDRERPRVSAVRTQLMNTALAE